MLLLVMMLPVLLSGLADPSDITHFVGRFAPAGPRLLFEIVLPLLAPPVEVLNRIFPPAVAVLVVDEHRAVRDRIVLCAVDEANRAGTGSCRAVVLERVRELPPVLDPFTSS